MCASAIARQDGQHCVGVGVGVGVRGRVTGDGWAASQPATVSHSERSDRPYARTHSHSQSVTGSDSQSVSQPRPKNAFEMSADTQRRGTGNKESRNQECRIQAYSSQNSAL